MPLVLTCRRRSATAAALAVACAVAAAPQAGSVGAANPRPPAVKVKNARFGYILQSSNKLPLYYWNREKRAGGKIRCTGECARVWPPLVLARGQSVPRRVSGIKGRFGVVRRPDGRRQVTHNGLPLYAYHDDPPNTVLCDNVDGWFVVRV